jgi:hypothetical protein
LIKLGADGPNAMRGRINRAQIALIMAAVVAAMLISGCTNTTRTDSATTSNPPVHPTAGPSTATSAPTKDSLERSPFESVAAAPQTESQTTIADARAAFIAAADAVCGQAERALSAISAPSGPADLVDTLKAQLQVQQDALAALGQLSTPEADRTEITSRLLDPYRDAIARQQSLLPSIANVVASGDHVQLATMHTDYDSASHPASVATFVREYGFQTCQSFDYFRGP